MRTRIARTPLPTGLASRVVRARRTTADHDLDQLRARLAEAWPRLAAESPRLSARLASTTAAELSLLGVSRSEGRTLFVFHADDLEPRLVLTAASSAGRANEAEAQQRAAELGVAPRHLGDLDGHLVQEGIGGLPLWIDSDRSGLVWPTSTLATVDQLHGMLLDLAAGTARPGHPGHLADVFAGLDRVPLDPTTLRRVRGVERDLASLDVQVLEHCDLSAQNVTVAEDGQVTGMVDWEFARADGVVGFDHLLVGMSLAEHGLGRWSWSDEEAYALLEQGWDHAPVFTHARDAARRTLEAVTGSAALAPHLEVAYMVERLIAVYRDGVSSQVGPQVLMRSLRLVLDR